jgi:predicted secreted protein
MWTFLAVYFIVWWLCFFVMLPIGVRTQEEAGEGRFLGTEPSAPARPMLGRKALAATLIAAVIMGILWVAQERFGLNLEAVSRLWG